MANAVSKEAVIAHEAFMAALLSTADPESCDENSLGFLRPGGIREEHQICHSAWFDGPKFFDEASQLSPLQQTTLQRGLLQQSASNFQVFPSAVEQASSSIINQTTVQHGRLQQSAFPLPDSVSVLHKPEVAVQHSMFQSPASQQKTMPLPAPSYSVHTSKKRHYYTEEEKKVWAVLEFGTTMKTWNKAITFNKYFGNPPLQNDLHALSRNLQSQTRFIKDTAFVQALISMRVFSFAEMLFIKRIIGFVPSVQLNTIGQFYERQPLPSAINNAANSPSPATSINFASAAHKNVRFSSGELRANTILHLVVPTGTTSLREELSRGFLRIYPSRFDSGPRRLADSLRIKFREQQTSPIALALEKMGEAKAVQDLDGAELKERIKLFIEITGVVRGARLDIDHPKWEAMKQGFEGLEELTWGEGLWGLWSEVKNEMYAGAQGLPDRF